MKVKKLERNPNFENIRGNRYRLLEYCPVSLREEGEVVTALSQDKKGYIIFDDLYMANELKIELVQENDTSS